MANPTTNYGFIMPTSTDLVTDLPADFDVFGQAVDTALLANANASISKSLIDAAGDLLIGTADNTVGRLGIGTALQVLRTNAGATAPEWAASAAGAMAHLKTSTFSNVANTGTTFDDLFTSTYDSYLIVFRNLIASTGTDDLRLQLRYAGTTTQAATYHFSYLNVDNAGTLLNIGSAGAATSLRLTDEMGNTATFGVSGTLTFTNLLSAGSRPYHNYSLFNEHEKAYQGGGYQSTSRIYTGFLFLSSASNISGTVSVYGLVKA